MAEAKCNTEEQGPGFDVAEFGNDINVCSLHTGNDVKRFCDKHDAVCCQVCIAMFHKTCQLSDLKQAAIGVRQSASLKRASFSLKVLSKNLADVKQHDGEKLIKLEQDRQNALIHINHVQKNIIKRLDELKESTCVELDSKCSSLRQAIHSRLKDVSDVINDVQELVLQFESENSSATEENIFHSLKQSKYVQEKADRFGKQKESRDSVCTIQFQPNDKIEQFIAGLTSLGDFEKDVNVSTRLGSKLNASLQGLYMVKGKQDSKQYGSFSSCLLDDGSVVIADQSNALLKRFNTSYKLTQTCPVPESPRCLCRISDNEVIVASTMNIYSVSVRDQLVLEKKVAKLESICHSMTFDQGLFYVAHGGGDYPRYLGVYDLHWKIQRKMCRDCLEYPVSVIVNRSHDRIYVADLYKGLLTFNKNGDCLDIYKDRCVNNPTAICEVASNVLLLTDEGSNKVLVIKEGKKKVTELLKPEDGIQQPSCLLFDEKRSRMIVLMTKSDHFRVYDLR